MRLFKLFALPVVALAAGCTGLPDDVEPVRELDLQRYEGTWYEIARLDHSFERGLSSVSAEYSLNTDGSVTVINRGYSVEEGNWQEAEGHAVAIADAPEGHLKVSFFGPFYASYVVFRLDDDYQTAYVSGFNKDYLWLLSRSPKVDDEIIRQFRAASQERGFDLGELIMVDQSRNLPEAGND